MAGITTPSADSISYLVILFCKSVLILYLYKGFGVSTTFFDKIQSDNFKLS